MDYQTVQDGHTSQEQTRVWSLGYGGKEEEAVTKESIDPRPSRQSNQPHAYAMESTQKARGLDSLCSYQLPLL